MGKNHRYPYASKLMLVIFVSHPLKEADGSPLCLPPRPMLPWWSLLQRLCRSLSRTALALSVGVYRASWERVLEMAPRARYLVFLCPGQKEALFFEEEETGRMRPVYPEELALIFPGPRGDALPEAALVLSPHGGGAAAVLHQAGIPLCLGVSASEELSEPCAMDLLSAFVSALGGGRNAREALFQAVETSGSKDRLDLFVGGIPTAPFPPSGRLSDRSSERLFVPVPRLPRGLVPPSKDFLGREDELYALREALRQFPRGLLLVTGGKGMGKTQLLRALYLELILNQGSKEGMRFHDLQKDPALPETCPRLLILDHLDLAEVGQVELVLRLRKLPQVLVACTEPLASLVDRASFVLRLCRLRPPAAATLLCLRTLAEPPRGDEPEGEERTLLHRALTGHPLALCRASELWQQGMPARSILSQIDVLMPLGTALTSLLSERPEAYDLLRVLAQLPSAFPCYAHVTRGDAADLEELLRRNFIELLQDGFCVCGPVAALVYATGGLVRSELTSRIYMAAISALAERSQIWVARLGSRDAPAHLAQFQVIAPWVTLVRESLSMPPEWLSYIKEDALTLIKAAIAVDLHQGHAARALALCQDSLRTLRDPALLCLHAEACLALSDLDGLRQAALDALTTSQALSDEEHSVQALVFLGILAEQEGRLAHAGARYNEALQRTRQHLSPLGHTAMRVQLCLSGLALRRGDFPEAEKMLRYYSDEALVFMDGRSKVLLGCQNADLLCLRPTEVNLQAAREYLEESLVLSRELGYVPGQIAALCKLGSLALRQAAFFLDDSPEEALLEARVRIAEARELSGPTWPTS